MAETTHLQECFWKLFEEECMITSKGYMSDQGIGGKWKSPSSIAINRGARCDSRVNYYISEKIQIISDSQVNNRNKSDWFRLNSGRQKVLPPRAVLSLAKEIIDIWEVICYWDLSGPFKNGLFSIVFELEMWFGPFLRFLFLEGFLRFWFAEVFQCWGREWHFPPPT